MAHQLVENNQAPGDDRSLGELFAELSRETSTLFRQEVALAKTEMTQKATRAGKDIGFLVAGAAILYAGLLAIIAAIIIALGHAIPMWSSALLVGIVIIAGAAFLVMKGINDLKRADIAPTTTLNTLKEDATWAKDQTR
jgi:hypothetical protein